ncbi:MAG TPA: HNH endonuclease signature motif containing protein [Jatrophihabitantaceae bacterium]|nr:HNH endonuclease signature motif containing protein [Jatrophihabitantaceae bacterium]
MLRSGTLPATGGISTTIVLTMTPDQIGNDGADGLVPTGHGALMRLDAARSLLGDAQVHPVLLGRLKHIQAYGETQRLFTAGQRLAMIARDHGCSFPGCTVGPAWCQAHHIQPYALGGRTSVDNGTLLCGYHHRHFERLGYACHMIDRVPHWTAPHWIDASCTPIRNTAHLPGPEPP